MGSTCLVGLKGDGPVKSAEQTTGPIGQIGPDKVDQSHWNSQIVQLDDYI